MGQYYIYGQLGKTLGPVYYQVGGELKAVAATLRYENLEVDRLSWTTRTVDLEATETVLPDVGQEVSLFYDIVNAGTPPYARLFRGHVTQARHRNYGTTVTVEGPWGWLRRNQALSAQSLGAFTDSRPTMIFPAGSVSTHLTSVLNAAIAAGAPFQLGSIATSYSIPKLQLSQLSYADIIAELMRWVPDGVIYFDYQSAPTGLPFISMVRRAGMGALTVAVGGAPTWGAVEYDVTGRPDLVPAWVGLKYVYRDTTGVPNYASQNAGTATAGKNQTILISGREGDTFLPKEDFQTYTAQTANANDTANNTKTRLLGMMPEVVASRLQHAGRPLATDVTLAAGEAITVQSSTNGTLGTRVYPQPTLKFIDATTGLEVSRVGKHYVLSPEPPEWAAGVLNAPTKVKITGRIYRLVEFKLVQTNGSAIEAPSAPSWVESFPWSYQTELAGYVSSSTNISYPLARVYLNALDFELETYLTTSNYSTPQTINKPQDFEYLAPPSGLASNLLSAQNFTPYEGTIRVQTPTAPAPFELSARYNITNAQTELASMNALAKAVTLDLLSFELGIELGAPTRFDFKTLAGKIRQTPQTNIAINP